MADNDPTLSLGINTTPDVKAINDVVNTVQKLLKEVDALSGAFKGVNIAKQYQQAIPFVKELANNLKVIQTLQKVNQFSQQGDADKLKASKAVVDGENYIADLRKKTVADQLSASRQVVSAEQLVYNMRQKNEADKLSASRDVVAAEQLVYNLRQKSVADQLKSSKDVVAAAQNIAAIQAKSKGVQADKTELVGGLYSDPVKQQQALLQATKLRIAELKQAQVIDGEITAELVKQIALEEKYTAQLAKARAEQRAANAPPPAAPGSPTASSINRVFGQGALDTFSVQAGLLANYAAIGGIIATISKAIQFTLEYEQALKDLQAVSASTNAEMTTLNATIISVSQASRFSATEVANAATTLAQAGFSSGDIGKALQGIVQLATATGSDLAQAVDLATSTIGAFNLRAGEMTSVANLLTAAANQTKLTIDKMALGFQYSANIANEAGVSVSELTAALGVMSNAGIRSGSTLGTGMRQILLELQAPSEKFITVLHSLGLTTEDVSLKSKTFAEVLQTLKDAGFTAADGLKVFETRSASAFAALISRTDEINQLNQSIVGTNAAAAANATQMESTISVLKRFGSVVGTVFSVGSGPTLEFFKMVVNGLTDFGIALSKNSGLLKTFGTVLSASAGAGFLLYFGNLLGLLKTSGPLFAAITTQLRGMAVASALAAGDVGLLSGALTLLSRVPVTVVFAGLVIALTAAIALFAQFGNTVNDTMKALDDAKGAVNTANDALKDHETAMASVDQAYLQVLERQGQLRNDSVEFQTTLANVTDQFGELKNGIFDNVTTVDQLIERFRTLKAELADDAFSKIREKIAAATDEARVAAKALDLLTSQSELGSVRRDFQPIAGKGFAINTGPTARNISNILGGVQASGQNVTEIQIRDALTALTQLKPAAEQEGLSGKMEEAVQALQKIQSVLGDQKQAATSITQGRSEGLKVAVQTTLEQFGLGDLRAKADAAQSQFNRDKETASSPEQADAAQKKFTDAITALNEQISRVMADPRRLAAYNDTLNQQGFGQVTYPQLQNSIKSSSAAGDLFSFFSNAQANLTSNSAVIAAGKKKLEELDAKALDQVVKNATSAIDVLSSDTVNKQNLATAQAGIEQKYDSLRQASTDKATHTQGTDKAFANAIRDKEIAALNEQENRELSDADRTYNDVLQKQEDLHREHQQKIGQMSVDAIDRLLKLQTQYILPSETEDDIKDRYDRAQQLLKQKTDAAFAELNTELSDPRFSDDERAGRRQALQDQLDGQAQALDQQFASLIVDAAGPMKSLKNFLTKFDQALKTIDLAYTQGLAAAQQQVDAYQRQIDATSLNQNKGQISPLAIKNLEFGKQDVQANYLKQQIALLEAKQTASTALFNELNAKFQAATADVEKARSDLQAAQGSGDQSQILFTQAIDDAKEKSYLDSKQRITEATKDQVDTQLTLNDALAQYNELTTKMEPTTLGQALSNVADYASGAKEGVDSLAVTVEKTLTTGVDAAKTGLTQFFMDISSGTKSAKAAFKDMAVGILQAMEQVVAAKAAEAFINLAFSVASSLYGGGSVPTNSAGFRMTGAGPGASAYSGKMIRAAGGTGITSRDYVPVLAQDGEFILRKSAVDMIGHDNLKQINALGNTTVAQSKPPAYTPPPPKKDNGNVNVWLVPKDSVPPSGPRDIVQVITDDMARGGPTRKLVHQIAMGSI